MADPTNIVTPAGDPTTFVSTEEANGTNLSFAQALQTIQEPEVST